MIYTYNPAPGAAAHIPTMIEVLGEYISNPRSSLRQFSGLCAAFLSAGVPGVVTGAIMDLRLQHGRAFNRKHPAAPDMLWDSCYVSDNFFDSPKRVEFAKALRHWLRAVQARLEKEAACA